MADKQEQPAGGSDERPLVAEPTAATEAAAAEKAATEAAAAEKAATEAAAAEKAAEEKAAEEKAAATAEEEEEEEEEEKGEQEQEQEQVQEQEQEQEQVQVQVPVLPEAGSAPAHKAEANPNNHCHKILPGSFVTAGLTLTTMVILQEAGTVNFELIASFIDAMAGLSSLAAGVALVGGCAVAAGAWFFTTRYSASDGTEDSLAEQVESTVTPPLA